MSANKLIHHAKEILDLNPKGRDCAELARRYNVCYVTMWKFLKNNGVTFNRETLDSTTQNKLLKDYAAGVRLKELGEKYGVDKNSARNYIIRNQVERLPQYRKCTINHDFFKTFTKESLWVLGWFFTDGNVSKISNGFSITIHRRDEGVLHTIRDLMSISSDSIYRRKNKSVSCFYGCDATVHEDLVSLGCTPNKSLTVKYPPLREDWQHWAFLRGVLEGDGHIGLKSYGNRPGFNCEIASGSKEFLVSIQSLLEKNNIKSKIECVEKGRGKLGDCCRLVVLGGRESVMRFLNAVYENGNAKHYLERKFKTYLQMKEIMSRSYNTSSINRYRHKEVFLAKDNTIYRVTGLRPFAREMGISTAVVYSLLKRKREANRYEPSPTGWSIATPSQVESARTNGTLVEKTY